MRRWWETGERSIEDEARWIREAGLDFELDRAVLNKDQVVVFNGDLRFGGHRVTANLVFPPGYLAGEHPIVVAPGLDIGRHRAPDGTLCLTHDVLGTEPPMTGVEAVERAERLWHLWEKDRKQLQVEEADAPDPWANYVEHSPGTSLALVDVDVNGGERGYIRVQLASLNPLRGAVVEVRTTHPQLAVTSSGDAVEALSGNIELNGSWKRLAGPPPASSAAHLAGWLRSNQRDLIDPAVDLARVDGRRRRIEDLPALVGFVYPDEGPARGETHDAWLFALVRPSDGAIALPRPFHLRRDEHWIRQPHLQLLEMKSVGLLGAGALGSPIAANLARAGVGSFALVDWDILTPGNRVRHDIDLSKLGDPKVTAVADRLRRINPWVKLQPLPLRFGGATAGLAYELQRLDDRIVDSLSSCHLIVNASAHGAAGSHCSRLGGECEKTVVHVWVSAGAWGGRILVQRSGQSACWDCLGLWQAEGSEQVPEVASDPAPQAVIERGCADLSFTGPNFEIAEVAAAAARIVVQELVNGAYPSADFDLVTINLRSADVARTEVLYSRLPIHPACKTCRD